MTTGRRRILAPLVLFIMLRAPGLALAGDCPIFVVGDWGVGKIDGKVMFYLGKARYLDTPIPEPPEGPRWDAAYRMVPGFAMVSIVCIAGLTRRRGCRRFRE